MEASMEFSKADGPTPGIRIPHSPIAIDTFKPAAWHAHLTPLFILTHGHADHTEGLTPTWNLGTIYCTHVTRKYVLHKFGLNPLLVVGMDLDVEHEIDLDLDGTLKLKLTFIDANHCPGAAMVLLKGYFGTALHTGDFRFSPAMLSHPALVGAAVDTLYLDNTYCMNGYDFVDAAAAAKMVVDVVLQHPEHQIMFGIDTLGKEPLLQTVAAACGMRVCVPKSKYESLLAIEYPTDWCTTDDEETRLIMIPRHQLTLEHIRALDFVIPTIGILPSGWAVARTSPEADLIWHIPYSLHTPRKDLATFVQFIQPVKVEATSCSDMGSLVALNELIKEFLVDRERLVPTRVPEPLLKSARAEQWLKLKEACKKAPRPTVPTGLKRSRSQIGARIEAPPILSPPQVPVSASPASAPAVTKQSPPSPVHSIGSDETIPEAPDTLDDDDDAVDCLVSMATHTDADADSVDCLVKLATRPDLYRAPAAQPARRVLPWNPAAKVLRRSSTTPQ